MLALAFALTSCKGGDPEFIFELRDADSYMVSVADANNAKTIVIPDTYEGKPVTAIKQDGFSGIKSVKEIIVPAGVDFIGDSAFAGCAKLTKVTLGSSVETIGGTLQAYVPSDSNSSTLPDGVGSITFPLTQGGLVTGENIEFVEVISPGSGYAEVVPGDKTGLTDDEIAMLMITDCIFSQCPKLTSIEVSADNANFKSVDGSLYTKDGAILMKYAGGKKDKTFTIPDGVTKFDRYAFENAENIQKIVIPDSLEAYDDEYLTLAYNYGIYLSFDEYKSGIFLADCLGVKEFVASGSNPNYKTIDGNLYTKDGSVLVYYASAKKDKRFTIPEGVTTIGCLAFNGALNVTSVTVSSSVNGYHSPVNISEVNVADNNETYKSIDGVLYSKDGKTLIEYPRGKKGNSYTTPDSVEVIAGGAFSACDNLKKIVFGDSVKTIESMAIVYCNQLKNISIGNGVTEISDYAFYFSTAINYNKYANACYLGNSDNPYVLLFKAQDQGITDCTVNENTKLIYASAFSGCHSLKSIVIPNGITKIVDTMFMNCSSLESVTIPESVTEIGHSAFSGCSSLTSVKLPAGLTCIGDSAFYNCQSLKSIDIPESVTEIGKNAFSGCSSLTSVKLPAGLTCIGDSAFYNCQSLKSIDIPESVTEIGKNAFSGCSSLTSVKLPAGLTCIGDSAFYNCQSLKSIDIPESVTEIGNGAFSRCNKLSSVVIPAGVTKIGARAFSNCNELESVTMPAIDSANFGVNVFLYSNNLRNIYFAGTEEEFEALNLKLDSVTVEFEYQY